MIEKHTTLGLYQADSLLTELANEHDCYRSDIYCELSNNYLILVIEPDTYMTRVRLSKEGLVMNTEIV